MSVAAGDRQTPQSPRSFRARTSAAEGGRLRDAFGVARRKSDRCKNPDEELKTKPLSCLINSAGPSTYPARKSVRTTRATSPRKGVAVIMRAANHLSRSRQVDDWHVLLCGNKGDESVPYEKMLTDEARAHVTFAGYRSDLERLYRGCYAALIMSTGWDSFPRSGMEVQASGLPLFVSDLKGINESVQDGVTGLVLKAGDAEALASAMTRLLDDREWRDNLSLKARRRIEENFTLGKQLSELTHLVAAIVSSGEI